MPQLFLMDQVVITVLIMQHIMVLTVLTVLTVLMVLMENRDRDTMHHIYKLNIHYSL